MKDGITKVLVTGSRDWDNWDILRDALMEYAGENVVLMHGDSQGADKMCGYIWEQWGFPVVKKPADWQRYGKAAGIYRNEAMVLAGPDIVLAFIKDNSRGATHCANFAKERRVPVRYFDYAEPTKREYNQAAKSDEPVAEPVF